MPRRAARWRWRPCRRSTESPGSSKLRTAGRRYYDITDSTGTEYSVLTWPFAVPPLQSRGRLFARMIGSACRATNQLDNVQKPCLMMRILCTHRIASHRSYYTPNSLHPSPSHWMCVWHGMYIHTNVPGSGAAQRLGNTCTTGFSFPSPLTPPPPTSSLRIHHDGSSMTVPLHHGGTRPQGPRAKGAHRHGTPQ